MGKGGGRDEPETNILGGGGAMWGVGGAICNGVLERKNKTMGHVTITDSQQDAIGRTVVVMNLKVRVAPSLVISPLASAGLNEASPLRFGSEATTFV